LKEDSPTCRQGFYHGGRLPSRTSFRAIRYAAARLDSIESAITAGYLNMGKDLPYTEAVDELIACFKEYNGQVYRNGHWTKPTAYEVHK
jgi:saccharopine dehydrogenase (NAD+, L-lysine-forming)